MIAGIRINPLTGRVERDGVTIQFSDAFEMSVFELAWFLSPRAFTVEEMMQRIFRREWRKEWMKRSHDYPTSLLSRVKKKVEPLGLTLVRTDAGVQLLDAAVLADSLEVA